MGLTFVEVPEAIVENDLSVSARRRGMNKMGVSGADMAYDGKDPGPPTILAEHERAIGLNRDGTPRGSRGIYEFADQPSTPRCEGPRTSRFNCRQEACQRSRGQSARRVCAARAFNVRRLKENSSAEFGTGGWGMVRPDDLDNEHP